MITIVHTQIAFEDFIVVVYRTEDSLRNKVKILLNTPVVYLKDRCMQQISPGDLVDRQVRWVDEEPILQNGLKLEVHLLDEELIRKMCVWCDTYKVTVDALMHGISCFLCNPDHRAYILDQLDQLEFLVDEARRHAQEKTGPNGGTI